MKEELLKGLTDEQIAKVKACKNTEEVLKVAKEEGFELTDEQLQAVSGGCTGTSTNLRNGKPLCPCCHSPKISRYVSARDGHFVCYKCQSCSYEFYSPLTH